MTQDNAEAVKNRLENNDVLMTSHIEDMSTVDGGDGKMLAVSLEAGDEDGIEAVKNEVKRAVGSGHIVGEKEVEGHHGIYVR
jgi:hypothetical protein